MASDLISRLVCPYTKGKLLYDRDNHFLVSRQAQLAFEIKGGVPNMICKQAMPLANFEEQFPNSCVLVGAVEDVLEGAVESPIKVADKPKTKFKTKKTDK